MWNDYYQNLAIMTDTADLFVRIGFCPGKVVLTNLYDGKRLIWYSSEHGHYQGAASSLGLAIVVTGGVALTTTAGIKLVKFTSDPIDTTSDPAAVDATNWHEANGIMINAAVDMLATDKMLLVEAWRQQFLWLKAYHDGTTSSNTYFEDSSYDFKELGVSGNGQWLIYNQTNGNYAYVKEVTKPAGKSKHCRVYTATDKYGTATTAADFDTSDVCYLFPVAASSYPMSDVGAMT